MPGWWPQVCPFRSCISKIFVNRRNVKDELTPARYELFQKTEMVELSAKTVLLLETCILLLNVFGCILLVCVFGLDRETGLASKISSVIHLKNPDHHEIFTKHFNIIAGLIAICGNLLDLGFIILLIKAIKECNWEKCSVWNFTKLVLSNLFLFAAIWVVANVAVFHWYFVGILLLVGYYRLLCFSLLLRYVLVMKDAEDSINTAVV